MPDKAALLYSIREQADRRNVTAKEQQRAVELYDKVLKQPRGGDRTVYKTRDVSEESKASIEALTSDTSKKSATAIAQALGVSPRKVERSVRSMPTTTRERRSSRARRVSVRPTSRSHRRERHRSAR